MDPTSFSNTFTAAFSALKASIATLAAGLASFGSDTLLYLFLIGTLIGAFKLMMGVEDFQASTVKFFHGLIVYFIVAGCINGSAILGGRNLPGLLDASMTSLIANGAGGYDPVKTPLKPLGTMTNVAMNLFHINMSNYEAVSRAPDSSASTPTSPWYTPSGVWQRVTNATTKATNAVIDATNSVVSLGDTVLGGILVATLTFIVAVFLFVTGIIFSGAVVMADVSFSIAVAFAPICIPWVLWQRASFLFEGWLRFSIGSGVAKVVAAVLCTALEGFFRVADQQAQAIAQDTTVSVIYRAFPMYAPLILMGFIALLMAQRIDRIASALTQGSNAAGFGMHDLKQGVAVAAAAAAVPLAATGVAAGAAGAGLGAAGGAMAKAGAAAARSGGAVGRAVGGAARFGGSVARNTGSAMSSAGRGARAAARISAIYGGAYKQNAFQRASAVRARTQGSAKGNQE